MAWLNIKGNFELEKTWETQPEMDNHIITRKVEFQTYISHNIQAGNTISVGFLLKDE